MIRPLIIDVLSAPIDITVNPLPLAIDRTVLDLIPAHMATRYMIIPLATDGEAVTVGMRQSTYDAHGEDLQCLIGRPIIPRIMPERFIHEAIHYWYGTGAALVEKLIDVKKDTDRHEEGVAASQRYHACSAESSITGFVDHLLRQALHDRATDIHIEPFETNTMIRYRVDGILHDVRLPEGIHCLHTALISRIKIMARLNIAEHRLPQDGRIHLTIAGARIDLRISIMPTLYGESVTIRVLSPQVMYCLEALGLGSAEQAFLETLIVKPHGIIFVTGPTGSGKTTTLYACLEKINDRQKKVITIEDPIEYQIDGVSQIQVHPGIGLTFANGLRSMLRHDPDIMMVGEVRDLETARITTRLALTGHLVLSTLHTNDAAGAVSRLLDMGIEPHLISSSLLCIIAQRLVRLVCRRCQDAESAGCADCLGTGYQGRTGIYELLPVDTAIKNLIVEQAPAYRIKQVARQAGMRTLRESAVEKCRRGLTRMEEVLRVTYED